MLFTKSGFTKRLMKSNKNIKNPIHSKIVSLVINWPTLARQKNL